MSSGAVEGVPTVMQHVKLGRTGLRVSRLCLGTMTFGLQCDATQSNAILDAAAVGGIDFLDTGNPFPDAPADALVSEGALSAATLDRRGRCSPCQSCRRRARKSCQTADSGRWRRPMPARIAPKEHQPSCST